MKHYIQDRIIHELESVLRIHEVNPLTHEYPTLVWYLDVLKKTPTDEATNV